MPTPPGEILQWPRRGALLTLMLLFWIPAGAQERGQEQDQRSQPQVKTTPKNPPAPLFRRHHRGKYVNDQGIDVVDATPQSPPLETDDPGVPDKGEYEINLSTFGNLSRHAQIYDLLFVDANYGILPAIAGHQIPTQVKLEAPVSAAVENGHPFTAGVGTAAFGLKFNFYSNEQRGLAASVYPQVAFVPPGTGAVEKGLAEPGQSFRLPLLMAKDLHYFTVVGNAGVEIPVHNPGDPVNAVLGAALGRALTNELAAMVEIRSESTLDFERDRLVSLNVGLIRGVGRRVMYARVGRSLLSDNGVSHTYLGVGIKIVSQP